MNNSENNTVQENTSKKNYDDLLTFISELVLLIDSSQIIINCNDKITEYTGYLPHEVKGRNISYLINAEKSKESCSNSSKGEKGLLRKKEGKKYSIRLIKIERKNTDNTVIIIKKTEEEGNQEAQGIRYSIETIIAEISRLFVNPVDFNHAVNTALERIGVLSGAGRSYLFVFREHNSIMDNTHEWCADGVSSQIAELQNLPMEIFPWWMKQLNDDQCIRVFNVSELPEEAKVEKEILEAQDIKSILVFPVWLNSILSGFIGFDNVTNTGSWSENNIKMLRVAAEIIGNALQRKNAVNALIDQFIFKNILIDSFPNPVFIKDRNCRIIDCNRAYEEMTGLNKNQVIGKTVFDIMDNHSAQKYDYIEKLILSGKRRLQRFETLFKCPDRTKKTILVNISGYSLIGNQVDGIIGVLQDITERKELETSKYRNLRNIEMLSRTALELYNCSMDKNIYQEISDKLYDITGQSYITICILDKKKEYFKAMGISGYSSIKDGINKILGDDVLNLSVPFSSTISDYLKNGDFVYFKGDICDLTDNQILPSEAQEIKTYIGYKALYLVGLYKNDSLYGFIIIATRKKEIPFDKKLVTAFINNASNAIGRWTYENELKESEERFRAIFDNMSSGVTVYHPPDKNMALIIKNYNKSGEKIDGIVKDEVIGKNIEHVYPDVKHCGLLDALYRVSKTGKSEYFLDFFYQDERISGWRCNYIFRLSTGEIVSVFDDITDKKQKEQEITQLNDSLSEKNTELEHIINIISHDLRSPLVNIHGFCMQIEKTIELLLSKIRDGKDKEEIITTVLPIIKNDMPEYLRFIYSGTEKMTSLLNGLLKIAKLEKSTLSLEKIDMNKLMAGVVQTFTFRIMERGTEVKITRLPECSGDELFITQLFTNLVDNALKFLHPGKIGIIRISGSIKNKYAVYKVADNGTGIPKDRHEQIFDIFYKENSRMEGEGLGLAMIKKIVSRHNGNITLDSEPGKGTTFYVYLPR